MLKRLFNKMFKTKQKQIEIRILTIGEEEIYLFTGFEEEALYKYLIPTINVLTVKAEYLKIAKRTKNRRIKNKNLKMASRLEKS